LEAVANKQLSELSDLDAATRKTLVGLCQAIHVQVGTDLYKNAAAGLKMYNAL
jgi:hypothetical protein